MFSRIFGGTDAEQLQFLEIRSIITIAAVVLALLGSMITPDALSLIGTVMLFVWGWTVIKNWFGFTSVAAIFSGNAVIGVVVFLIYVFIAYLVGLLFAFLGVGRWIYLKIRRRP